MVGADGINSFVRAALWGDAADPPSASASRGRLPFLDGAPPTEGASRTTGPRRAATPPSATKAARATSGGCSRRATRRRTSPRTYTDFAPRARPALRRSAPVARSSRPRREHLQRWEIRDRKPLKQWSKGRVTLVGDAAHPTSPYAAYGAGMSIEDGYFLASRARARRPRATPPRCAGRCRRSKIAASRTPRRSPSRPIYTGSMFHRTAASAAPTARPRVRPHAAAAEGHRRRHAEAHPQAAGRGRRGRAPAAGVCRRLILSGASGIGPEATRARSGSPPPRGPAPGRAPPR